MSSPSRADRGTRLTFGSARAVTFRFAAPARIAVVRLRTQARIRWPGAERVRMLLGADAVPATANNDTRQPTKNTTTRDTDSKRAPRTAGMRLPYPGEMEQLHDIYGGVLADGSDPGSA
jgi:hypothetical protein